MTPQRIIWLASFHKSGNTWVRAFLANYLAPKGTQVGINQLLDQIPSDVSQKFYNQAVGAKFRGQSFDDSIALRPKVQRLIAASQPGHQFVKTHSKLGRIGPVDLIAPEVTAAAVYILRNPFDLAPSYARHGNLPVDKTIENMCDPKALTASETGIFEVLGRWDDHVASWTSAKGLPIHVMRYEDMLADPERAFRGMLGFLQIPVQDGQLRRTLRATSFEALKKQEEKEGFRERPGQMKQFFARGKAGTWREDLSRAQILRLRDAFRPTLAKWYPDLLAETDGFRAAE